VFVWTGKVNVVEHVFAHGRHRQHVPLDDGAHSCLNSIVTVGEPHGGTDDEPQMNFITSEMQKTAFSK